jgi:hypothetical protein
VGTLAGYWEAAWSWTKRAEVVQAWKCEVCDEDRRKVQNQIPTDQLLLDFLSRQYSDTSLDWIKSDSKG